MFETLKILRARLRAWMAANERAHREAKVAPCCRAPAGIRAAPRGAQRQQLISDRPSGPSH